jgi:aspartyl-tRNA(Asn)/glutamyl-tRNA(Gln) amidotransferase subunit B
MVQVSDTSAIEAIVDAVLSANPKPVAEYRAGKASVFAFLIGQVMRQAKGTANPQVVREVLTKKLS